MDSGIRFMFQKPSKFFFCKHYLFLEILSYCQNCQHQDSASRTEDDCSLCVPRARVETWLKLCYILSRQHYML